MKLFIYILLFMCLKIFSVFAGINDKQKFIIKQNIFLINENLMSEKFLFEKTKLFDSKGFFGINEDKMTEKEFNDYLEKQLEKMR